MEEILEKWGQLEAMIRGCKASPHVLLIKASYLGGAMEGLRAASLLACDATAAIAIRQLMDGVQVALDAGSEEAAALLRDRLGRN